MSKFVRIPRFTIQPDQFLNKNSLEELAEMGYAYANKEEEEYYTKWKKDLEEQKFNEGRNEGRNEAIKMMSDSGIKIDQISDIMKIPVKEVSDILTANS